MSIQTFKTPRSVTCLVLLVLLTIGAIISAICLPKQYVTTGTFNTEKASSYHTVSPDDVITHTFIADVSFERIGFLFASDTPHYPNGTIDILISTADQPDALCQQPLPNLVDMTYVYCDYHGSAGSEYQLTITTTDNQLQYGFYIASSAKNPDTTFFINDEPREAVIITAFYNQKPDYFIFWYFIMAAALVICYLILTIDKEAYEPKKS